MALAFLRRHKWWFNWFLVAIIVSFIYLYIPMFTGDDAAGSGAVVARVGKLEVTSDEFRRTWLRQKKSFERMYQGMDPAVLKRLGLEEQALDALVVDRVMRQEADRLGLRVDDDAVARYVATSPQYQENGQYVGAAVMKRWLESEGMSEAEFVDSVRGQLLRERLEALVTDGVTVTPADAEKEYRRRNEKVKAEYVLVDAARFRPQVQVSEDEIKARFDSKKDAYRIPERRVVSYVLVQPEALANRVAVTEREVQDYFDAHQDEYKEEQQVCATHILIKAKATPDAKEGHSDAEARSIAQGLLDKARAGGDFAALAKASSEDEGSAPSGGDLGCFGRGRMVPEFEQAAFALETGQISDLVKTTYGYHVIKVVSRKDEAVPALATVKDRVRAELMQSRTQTMADEQAGGLRAAIASGRSLEEAARQRGLTVLKSPPIERGAPVAPLASQALVARAFQLKQGETASSGFPVGQGTAFIQLAEIQPAHAAELKDVHDKVKTDLTDEKAFAQARALAAQVASRAPQEGLDKAAAALGLDRKETASPVSREEAFGDLGTSGGLDAAFALPQGGLSEPLRVTAGYAVVRVLEKTGVDPAAFAKEQASLVQSLREQRRGQLFQSYLNQAKQRFEIVRYADAIQRITG
jgi:peptidyl-prolyl cis-trans isomerase D